MESRWSLNTSTHRHNRFSVSNAFNMNSPTCSIHCDHEPLFRSIKETNSVTLRDRLLRLEHERSIFNQAARNFITTKINSRVQFRSVSDTVQLFTGNGVIREYLERINSLQQRIDEIRGMLSVCTRLEDERRTVEQRRVLTQFMDRELKAIHKQRKSLEIPKKFSKRVDRFIDESEEDLETVDLIEEFLSKSNSNVYAHLAKQETLEIAIPLDEQVKTDGHGLDRSLVLLLEGIIGDAVTEQRQRCALTNDDIFPKTIGSGCLPDVPSTLPSESSQKFKLAVAKIDDESSN